MQWRDRGEVGSHLETARLHRVRWAAPSSHHLHQVGPNHARRPYLTVTSRYRKPTTAQTPLVAAARPKLNKANRSSVARFFFDTQRGRLGTFVRPTAIPKESSESVRAFSFKRHNVNMVLRRPLLHLLALLVFFHIDALSALSDSLGLEYSMETTMGGTEKQSSEFSCVPYRRF
jgi:hypothetical protein